MEQALATQQEGVSVQSMQHVGHWAEREQWAGTFLISYCADSFATRQTETQCPHLCVHLSVCVFLLHCADSRLTCALAPVLKKCN